jgi:hypothetical protein
MRWKWACLGIVGVSVALGAAVISYCRVAIKQQHSQKTLKRWAAWRVAHPAWKKSTAETLAALDFTCGPIATLDATTPATLVPFQSDDNVAALEPSLPLLPKTEIPSEPLFASTYAPPQSTLPYSVIPLPVPVAYPAPSPVPEPSSFIFMLSGLAALCVGRQSFACTTSEGEK